MSCDLVRDIVREYLLLGLWFDRLIKGFVDAYTGDGALRRQVDNEPRPDPAVLARRAAALRAELPATGLPAPASWMPTCGLWSAAGACRHRMGNLAHLAAYEAHPGHYTERCLKEAGLVGTEHHVEQTIFLVNTPQYLMAEGLADLGLRAAVGPGWGPWAQEILGDVGLRMDGELTERLEAASVGLSGVQQDAALILHD